MLGGIQPTETQVGLERVGIGGEVEGVAENHGAGSVVRSVRSVFVVTRATGWKAGATGSIQRREKLVEIGGGLAGETDLVGRGTEKRGDFPGDGFGEREPPFDRFRAGGLIAKCFELMMLKIVKGVRHEKFCRPLVLEALTRTGEALIFEFKSLIAFYVWAIDV